MNLSGQRVAIAGLGVSGRAVALAAQQLGATPTVFDQKPNDAPALIEAVDDLTAQGIEVVTGWHGRLDPNDFDIFVPSPGFPRDHPAVKDALRGGRPVLSEIEFAFRIAKAPILAITGTNGKSTTTVMLWSLLRGQGQNAWLCGNIAGSGYPEMPLTEAAARANSGEILVAEVSSFQLEWVDQFRPRVAAITNVTPDHMDRYKSFQDYLDTKLRIFAKMDASQAAVVNVDEAHPQATDLPDGLPAVLVSPSGKNRGTGQTERDGGVVKFGDFESKVGDLPLYGDHNLANAMVAWEMASQVVEPNQGMWHALLEFKGLAHRMERVGSRDGIMVVNNSMCTNPAALIASSRSVAGRQHLLIGGETKGLDYSSVGDYLRKTPHKIYAFGADNGPLLTTLGIEVDQYSSLEEAFATAVREAEPGDTVLLAPGCASSYPFTNFRERGDAFRALSTVWIEGGSL